MSIFKHIKSIRRKGLSELLFIVIAAIAIITTLIIAFK